MKRYIALFLLLGGCANHTDPVADYQPNLAQKPKNHAIYANDLAECKEDSKPTSGEHATAMFGLLGILALSAQDSDRVWDKPETLVNKCMTKRGYELKS